MVSYIAVPTNCLYSAGTTWIYRKMRLILPCSETKPYLTTPRNGLGTAHNRKLSVSTTHSEERERLEAGQERQERIIPV
jgi:hypothetical protein